MGADTPQPMPIIVVLKKISRHARPGGHGSTSVAQVPPNAKPGGVHAVAIESIPQVMIIGVAGGPAGPAFAGPIFSALTVHYTA